MNLHTCNIAKRGKGAEGYVSVQTLGIPQNNKSENGLVYSTEWDYSKLESVNPSELMNHARELGYSISVLLAEAIDARQKSAAIKADNPFPALVRRVIEAFKLEDEKKAESLARQIQTVSKSLGVSLDESFNMVFKARK